MGYVKIKFLNFDAIRYIIKLDKCRIVGIKGDLYYDIGHYRKWTIFKNNVDCRKKNEGD